jgi:hypothetical protein
MPELSDAIFSNPPKSGLKNTPCPQVNHGIRKVTLPYLRAYLKEHGLGLSGKKDELVERVMEHVQSLRGTQDLDAISDSQDTGVGTHGTGMAANDAVGAYDGSGTEEEDRADITTRIWSWQSNSGWIEYGAADQRRINDAYIEGDTTVRLSTDYICDFDAEKQYKASDSTRTRNIKSEESTGPNKRARNS